MRSSAGVKIEIPKDQDEVFCGGIDYMSDENDKLLSFTDCQYCRYE